MSNLKQTQPENQTDNATGGIILIAIGLLFLLNQLIESFDFSAWILPLLSLCFLIAGIVNRKSGYFTPAGIIGGVFLGINVSIFAENMFPAVDSGAFFLFGFALGWISILPLSAFFGDETYRWPLIPAGIISAIGLLALLDEQTEIFFNLLSLLWPVALIGLGLYLWLKPQPRQKDL